MSNPLARNAVSAAVACAIGITSFGMNNQAFAQQAGDGELSQVVVTGSRIVRDANIESPTAVTTIDATAIEESGLINVAQVLRTLPSFGVSGITSSNSNFQTANSGLNTLELRNLGEDRTLVLVNGRRYVSGLAGSSAVDFNTIPTELVERIEVITGGASAVYGSDALAGVINVILKKDFDGAAVSYQFGEADKGGDIESRYNLLLGGEFAEGRGNAVISATYSENKGTFARQRPNTEVDDLAGCYFGDPCTTSVTPFFSSFSESGRFFVPSTGQSFSVDDSGQVQPWSSAAFGFNRQAFRRYTIPTDRYLLSTLVDYEITSGVSAYAEAMFAQTRTETELEPFPHSNSDLNIGGIPVDNPFVPTAIRDAVLAAGDDVVEYFRRMTEVGQRGSSATRNTYRFAFGLEGEMDNGWRWDSFMTFGRMDDAQQGGGQINVASMRNALDVVDGDGDASTFDPVCRSSAARAEGCVPINIFGKGSISDAAARYVRAPTSRQQLTEQQVFGASIVGPIWSLSSGDISLALGAEYRTERAEDVPDVLTQGGLNAGNAEAPTFGEFDVREAFAEIEVPITESLSFGGAFRYSDYSTVGETESYAGRLAWSPVESVRFRFQAARAVRAPNIAELYSPGGENFAPVADPCNNVTAASTGNVAVNCRSVASIAARIAATGSFTLTQTEIQGTGGFTGRGNLLLEPETADTISVGVVWDGDLGQYGNLTASVDYFDIKIEQAIDTVGRQAAVSFCYSADPANFPNQFCSLIVRDGSGAAFQLGEIREVNSGFINEGTSTTEGVDLAVSWIKDLADLGRVSVRANYTHLLGLGGTSFGERGDSVGTVGSSEDKVQAGVTYSLGAWTANWEWTFLSDAKVSESSPFDYNVGSYSVHDLRLVFDLGKTAAFADSGMAGMQIYAGANNILDEDAPIILTGVPGNTTGTDTNASVYNPLGRTWYVGVRHKF